MLISIRLYSIKTLSALFLCLLVCFRRRLKREPLKNEKGAGQLNS